MSSEATKETEIHVGNHVHRVPSSHHLHTLSSDKRSGPPEKGLGIGLTGDEEQTRSYRRTMNQIHPNDEREYIPIADHALIGNLRTAALVSLDGSVESYCVPHFDSPSVFARILDKDKGGHFSITPLQPFTTKQNYLPSSNVLQTKFMNDSGVVSVTDFLPRPPLGVVPPADGRATGGKGSPKPLLQWLIRRVECVRGTLPLRMECAPAFNYARDAHTTTIVEDDTIPLPVECADIVDDCCNEGSTDENPHECKKTTKHLKAVFDSPSLTMDLRWVAHDAEGVNSSHWAQSAFAHVKTKERMQPYLHSSDSESDGEQSQPPQAPPSAAQSQNETENLPDIPLTLLDLSEKGHQGPGVQSDFWLKEGQGVTFVFRIVPDGEHVGVTGLKDKTTHQKTDDRAAPSGVSGAVVESKEARDGPSQASIQGKRGELLKQVGGTEKAIAKARYLGKRKSRTILDRRPGDDPWLTEDLVRGLLSTTAKYWADWVRQSTYTGSWKESVLRSALALKLLIFEPTGAVVASPTFSLPEYIGGVRNWDYRYSWIRDSSFTLYALIRLGFTQEANAYLEFIFDRLRDKNPDGSIQIMYTIHGDKDMEELELTHLDGHKGSKPVRIGNGAADHVQLDIYGELMDCIYLGQKFGKPLSYDDWVLVREIVDYVCDHCKDPDLSIWEVRDMKRNFTYSKVMLWVAIDRGLRLAEKRSLPCPNRNKWLQTRDERWLPFQLYEEIMHKAWNPTDKFFGQSYEETDIVDAAVLIMPLVFFMQASDPRFVSTLKRVMKTPEKGGLTANNLVYRYDVRKSGDGVGGEEGTFCLCTLWCVEALTRAGKTDRALLVKAVSMFEDFLLYLNHVGLCTEEISDAGEALGNAVQGFTHVTLISAAYNLSRTMGNLHQPSV
ncbi:glycoside hydrolase family 15 protein [Coprinopsis sp. MPI-PUGE-AT-0042]|nr:glycoside hydrolase family 15 protein [Coprinopsis sp. MPI-PUGE-AT-0042]